MMKKDRVTYFSDYDGSIWMYRPRFIEVMEMPELVCRNLADALELYHIKLFVDKELLKTSFKKEEWVKYLQKAKTIPEKIARYLKDTMGNDLANEYGKLDFSYHQSFWDALEGYGQAEKLSDDEMKGVLDNSRHTLSSVLSCKKIVRAKNEFLRDYMMTHPESAEIVLSQKVEQHREEIRPCYLPTELDVDRLLDSYISMPEPNGNYLRMILNASDNELTIVPALKIKAKAKMQEQYEKEKSNLISYTGKYGVEFSDKFEEIKELFIDEDGTHILRYNSNFFLDRDDAGVIAILGPVFDYLDEDRRITLVKNEEEANVFERFLMRAKSEYSPNNAFYYKNVVAVAQLACLDHLIKVNGRNIERAIEAYFNEHIKKGYGLPFSDIRLLSDGSWTDRAKVLLPLFDLIVKQYNLFVEHGQLTADMMLYYPGIPVTDSKSHVKYKYCQEVDNVTELNTINYLLFSDQSMLGYVDPFKEKNYGTLYEIMTQEEVKYDAYQKYQRVRIDMLVDNGYVKVDENGVLRFVNENTIDVLLTLYQYRVCSFWWRSPEQRVYLLELMKRGWAVADNHLLSEPERNYFSYYLNDRQYSDAESLRNKILHGVVDDVSVNDYYKLLLLLVLLLLKIDDDLRLFGAIVRTAERDGHGESRGQ